MSRFIIKQGGNIVAQSDSDQLSYSFPKNETKSDIIYNIEYTSDNGVQKTAVYTVRHGEECQCVRKFTPIKLECNSNGTYTLSFEQENFCDDTKPANFTINKKKPILNRGLVDPTPIDDDISVSGVVEKDNLNVLINDVDDITALKKLTNTAYVTVTHKNEGVIPKSTLTTLDGDNFVQCAETTKTLKVAFGFKRVDYPESDNYRSDYQLQITRLEIDGVSSTEFNVSVKYNLSKYQNGSVVGISYNNISSFNSTSTNIISKINRKKLDEYSLEYNWDDSTSYGDIGGLPTITGVTISAVDRQSTTFEGVYNNSLFTDASFYDASVQQGENYQYETIETTCRPGL